MKRIPVYRFMFIYSCSMVYVVYHVYSVMYDIGRSVMRFLLITPHSFRYWLLSPRLRGIQFVLVTRINLFNNLSRRIGQYQSANLQNR